MLLSELTEGLIKVPEKDFNSIVQEAIEVALIRIDHSLIKALYESPPESGALEIETNFKKYLSVIASKLGVKYNPSAVTYKDRYSSGPAIEFKQDFGAIEQSGTFSHYNLALQIHGGSTSLGSWSETRNTLTINLNSIFRFNSISAGFAYNPHDLFYYITPKIKVLKSTVQHELMHMVQYKVHRQKDKRQVHSDIDRAAARDVDQTDKYLSSNVEFYPWIRTSVDEFLNIFNGSLDMVRWVKEDYRDKFNTGLGFYVGLGDPSKSHLTVKINDGWSLEFPASPFFKSIKDKKGMFTYKKAVREFVKAVNDTIDNGNDIKFDD